jgi:Zn-dependent protease/CBS domain-containing protein
MRGIRIGSAFGIPIKLNVTFLLVLPLFAWLIGADIANLVTVIESTFGVELAAEALTVGNLPWILGTASALGLFAGILLHELGHSVVAIYYGYEIESITLWLFGGVAQFTEIPEDWRQELAISIAGPIVSVALGLGFAGAFLLFPPGVDAARFVIGYLAILNVVLAVFNMLPGFPMDGGRVLRALLTRSMPHARATQIAAEVGKGFAILLGLVGLFANLFLVALAFFIYIGASGEAQQTVMRAAFRDVSVRDVMTGEADLHTVEADESIAELMRRMLQERHTGYPVVDDGDLVGMITLGDAREVQEVERDAYTVGDVMSRELYSVTPESEAIEALELMQENNVGRLPVVDGEGKLVGLISRTDLMTAFNIIQSRGFEEDTRALGGQVEAR